jgi:hypothetical protein
VRSVSTQALVAIRYDHARIVEPAGEAGPAAPGTQQGLLDMVLGIRQRPEHAVAVHLQLVAVPLDLRPELRVVARTRYLDLVERSLAMRHVIHTHHDEFPSRKSSPRCPPSGEGSPDAWPGLLEATQLPAERTIAVVSGGNLDPALLAALVGRPR